MPADVDHVQADDPLVQRDDVQGVPGELVARYQGKEGPGLKNPVYGGQIEATDRAVGRDLMWAAHCIDNRNLLETGVPEALWQAGCSC